MNIKKVNSVFCSEARFSINKFLKFSEINDDRIKNIDETVI